MSEQRMAFPTRLWSYIQPGHRLAITRLNKTECRTYQIPDDICLLHHLRVNTTSVEDDRRDLPLSSPSGLDTADALKGSNTYTLG